MTLQKSAIIFIGTFFQQVLVIANSVRKTDPALIEAAQTLGAGKRQLVTRVIIPASITDIYTDMRILLGWAWTYLIVSEVVGTTTGITFFINQQARYRQFDNVYAAIIIIGLVGFFSDVLLARLGRILFPWQRRASTPGWPSRLQAWMATPGTRALSCAVADPSHRFPPWHDSGTRRLPRSGAGGFRALRAHPATAGHARSPWA